MVLVRSMSVAACLLSFIRVCIWTLEGVLFGNQQPPCQSPPKITQRSVRALFSPIKTKGLGHVDKQILPTLRPQVPITLVTTVQVRCFLAHWAFSKACLGPSCHPGSIQRRKTLLICSNAPNFNWPPSLPPHPLHVASGHHVPCRDCLLRPCDCLRVCPGGEARLVDGPAGQEQGVALLGGAEELGRKHARLCGLRPVSGPTLL